MDRNKTNRVQIILCLDGAYYMTEFELKWKVMVCIWKFFSLFLKKKKLHKSNQYKWFQHCWACSQMCPLHLQPHHRRLCLQMWWLALNLSFPLTFVSPPPILKLSGKKITLSQKKGHNFWRCYISICQDTSSFRLRLNFLSVTNSLNHLSEWTKICIALQTLFQWLFLPFLEKNRLRSWFNEVYGQLRLEQFCQFCSISKQQRRSRFRVLLCLFLCKLIVFLQFMV